MNQKKKLHVMGVNGSGISGVACLAKSLGYEISGCDLNAESDYTAQLKNAGIPIQKGHSENHLKDADIVIASPAIYYNKNLPEEARIAIESGIFMKWQDFFGRFILPNYGNVIGVCGTHGKTTTTALLGRTLQTIGLDPTVIVGGIVPEWNAGTFLGKSKWLICEADEYDYNFISYHPNIVLFTNLEMEHPEKFNNYEEYVKTFHNFFLTIKQNGLLIADADDENSVELIRTLHEKLKMNGVKIIGFSETENLPHQNLFDQIHHYSIIDSAGNFETHSECYQLSIPGKHNIKNAMAVFTLCRELKISTDKIRCALKDFVGVKRRLEKVYDSENIKIYSDYAHHHSQVRASLTALKACYPKEKLIAILEPHQISRIAANGMQYMEALNIADHIIIAKIYEGREAGKSLPDMRNLIHPFRHKTNYIDDDDVLTQKVLALSTKQMSTIVVMGAGDSYKLANKIKEQIKSLTL